MAEGAGHLGVDHLGAQGQHRRPPTGTATPPATSRESAALGVHVPARAWTVGVRSRRNRCAAIQRAVSDGLTGAVQEVIALAVAVLGCPKRSDR